MTKVIAGVIFLSLGIIYSFMPGVVLWFNQFVREVLCNDRTAILQRKKIAIVFYLLALGAILSGILSILENRLGILSFTDQKLYQAYQDYYQKNFLASIKNCQEVLAVEPDNETAHLQIAQCYRAMGNYALARNICQRVLQKNPQNQYARKILLSLKQNEPNKR